MPGRRKRSEQEGPRGSTPVHITSGFFQSLPPQGVQFVDVSFERRFPKPLQPIVGQSWQKSYPIWKHKLPPQHGLVIRDLEWTAFRNDNIGVGGPKKVEPGVLSESVGYQFLIGSRWKLNLNNNLQGAGSPFVATAGGNVGIGLQESSVPSGMDPTGASFSRRFGAQGGFVLYARPQEILESRFFAFASPPVDVLKISFRLNGWQVPSVLLDHLLSRGQWGLDGLKR